MNGGIVFRKPYVKRQLIGGEWVVVIQSKNRRLGMGLIGQVIVSRDLVERLGVTVMKSVGVCTGMDRMMHQMLRKHPRCRAVVYPAAKGREGIKGRLKGAKVQIGLRPVERLSRITKHRFRSAEVGVLSADCGAV